MAQKKTTKGGVDRAWLKSLASEPLKSIYIMYGEERYRIAAAVDILKKRLVPEGTEGFNFVELTGKGLHLADITEAMDTIPFLSDTKLILIKGYDLLSQKPDDVSELLTHANEQCITVFMAEKADWKPDKRTKVYKEVASKAEFAEFAVATAEELSGFVTRCFLDAGKRINKADLEYMLFLCSPLMASLKNEAEKISAHCTGDVVTRSDIDAVATRAVEAKIFEMCDALCAGHYGTVLTQLEDMKFAQEPGIVIVSLIARQFRQLYCAALNAKQGHGTKTIMEHLGIRFPFIAEKLLSSARQTTLPAIRRALIACEQADVALKSSRTEEYEVIKLLILQIAEASKC